MKQKFSLFLLIVSLLLCGCIKTDNDGNETTFYYIRENHIYSSEQTVFITENRSVSGDLSTILDVYLSGPVTKGMVSPFPEDVKVQSLSIKGERLYLDLGANFANLSGIELTLACSALSKTCFQLCGARDVSISAGNRLLDGKLFVTINTETILTSDNSIPQKEKK